MNVWINGEVKRKEDASVSCLTHTLHYGTGVFEGIRSYETRSGATIFRLDDHVRRLFDSAKILGMDIPFSKSEISEACVEIVNSNELTDAYIRPIVMFGQGGMGLDVNGMNVNPVEVIVMAWKWDNYFTACEGKGIHVCISDWQRVFSHACLTQAKAVGSYLSSYMAYMIARNQGFDESILVDDEDNIVEASASNVFMIKGETLYTPKTTYALDGITRDTVIRIADILGITTVERDIKRNELLDADEAFLTGTACEVMPILSIDKIKIETGLLTSKIAELYNSVVHHEGVVPSYESWYASV